MSKKRIRGILDLVSLADGEEWEIEPMSEDFVVGMGMGATKDATRWAYKGFSLEAGQAMKNVASKKSGRPQLAPYQHIDCRRAYAIWDHVNTYIEEQNRSKLSNRGLIQELQKLETKHAQLVSKRQSLLFPITTESLETSVSRGKTALKIDQTWSSEVCEKLRRYYSQTTD
jgi:hypothetical protein